MSRRNLFILTTVAAGAGLALIAAPGWADRECFEPSCQKPVAKPVAAQPPPPVTEPASPPRAEAAATRRTPQVSRPTRIIDVTNDVAGVDALPATGPQGPPAPAASPPQEKIYDSVEVVRHPAPVEADDRPSSRPKLYDSVEVVRHRAPAAREPERATRKTYDSVEVVRQPAPEPRRARSAVREVDERAAPAERVRAVRADDAPRPSARPRGVPSDAEEAPDRIMVRDENGVPRPLYLNTPRPVRVVEQGPVYRAPSQPSYVVDQGPRPSVAVVAHGYGYGYDNAIVVAQPDPTVRYCQVNTPRGVQAVLCGPYSYRPYGEPGYRPLGAYQPARAPQYYAVAPDPRIIRLEPDDR